MKAFLRIGLIALVSAVFATASAHADAPTKACTGVLPLAITPPAGGFATGCLDVTDLSPWPASGAGYNGVYFPSCDAGDCAGRIPQGTEALHCLMSHGSACCIHSGDAIHAAPASQLAAFRAALRDRWDNDSDQREDVCLESYAGSGQRLLLVPVTSAEPDVGGNVVIQEFVTAFLVARPGLGARTELRLQVLPELAVPVHAPTWGQIRTLYR